MNKDANNKADALLPLIFGNDALRIELLEGSDGWFNYSLQHEQKQWKVTLPKVEINGELKQLKAGDWRKLTDAKLLRNGATEYSFIADASMPTLSMACWFRVAPDNPVVKFRFELFAKEVMQLTKVTGKDNIRYFETEWSDFTTTTEVRLSEFNEKAHATHLTESPVNDKWFANELTMMGPLFTGSNGLYSMVLGYEHGSQYPNRFLEFACTKNRSVGVQAVKANYLANQQITSHVPFESIWFEIGAVKGSEDDLAATYRDFVLRYLAEYNESRKPYIYYNTWGRQEWVKWGGGTYLETMNLEYTLREIDRAHAMGVEVYVLDTGWYEKAGDWEVSKKRFPDGLQQVKARLDAYGMKLGLWFNPTAAALTSRMLERNRGNMVSKQDEYPAPIEIWETEKSCLLCLVSEYWKDYAHELIRIIEETGVRYFKWDAIAQYACDGSGHHHGSDEHSYQERADRYAFLLPVYMGKVIERVHQQYPDAIFDFDITEDGRAVGLQFLAHGKYFIINNGPYYHNFDVCEEWKSPTADGNPNIFVNPGAARGWFMRTMLDYDRWIPSILFLAHYYPYSPRWSQMQNIASLLLGHNGIWGAIDQVNDEDVIFFERQLGWYKQVRDYVTQSTLICSGLPGDSHEIYEKIEPQSGKGLLVIIANHQGCYNYITNRHVSTAIQVPEGVKVRIDEEGSAVLEVAAGKQTAYIFYFGVS
jgi:alpha-galactosidase